jgi:transposase
VLTRYLGWTVQRPVQRFADRNEELINRWKAEEFPHILKEVQQRRAHLVFMDESGFLLAPTVCRTFSPRGQPPVIKVSDPHGRISAIGAISISPIRKHLSFFHQMLHDNANFRADSVVQFVSAVSRRLSGPITFVCDACPIHCTKLMRAFLDKHTSIEIEEFPPYAPELNPVDKAWGYLKHGRLANYAPCTLTKLRNSLTSEFCALKHKRKVIAWCVRKAGLESALE